MAKNVGLVIVGDGVLNGEFVDGASTVLIAELEKAGARISNIAISSNSADSIDRAIKELIANGSDNIVTLGALGVDLRGHNHRAGVAKSLGCNTDFYPEIETYIKQFCRKPELRAHSIQSELFVAYDTGATIPLFVNVGKFSQPVAVASFSGYPDLMVHQIGAYIENVILPEDANATVNYPELFSSRELDQLSIPASDVGFLRLVDSQIRSGQEYELNQQGVDIYFDISKFTPARYAYLAASLREKNISIRSVYIDDFQSKDKLKAKGITIVVPSSSLDQNEGQSFTIGTSIQAIDGLIKEIEGTAPKSFRATIKTNVQLGDLQNFVDRFDEEILRKSPMYVAVPNLDDPTTGANIEIRSTTIEDLNAALTYVANQAEINGWEIHVNSQISPASKIAKELFQDSKLPRSIMDSDKKTLWPLPDNISLEYSFLISNAEATDNTERAKELVNKLTEIFQTQNTPGDYEFEVYKESLGMLRPVAIIAINELCVAYDLDLPEIVTPEVFEKAFELLNKSNRYQLEKLMDPSSGIAIIDQN